MVFGFVIVAGSILMDKFFNSLIVAVSGLGYLENENIGIV